MGIHFQMAEPDRDICYVTFEPTWTWAEFDGVFDAMIETIGPIPHPVALITDVAQVGRLPNGNVLMHLRRTDTLMPDNVDIAVLINAPPTVTTFMSIIMRVRPRVRQLTRFAYSLEEAQALVAAHRQHHEHVRE